MGQCCLLDVLFILFACLVRLSGLLGYFLSGLLDAEFIDTSVGVEYSLVEFNVTDTLSGY